MDYPQKIARALLHINAVGFCVETPITFTSGMKAPVYVDNRRFPFWPSQWRLVIEAFEQKITDDNLSFDVIAGIETAGIPHSSALAYALQKPSVFVRKKPKEHGTKSRIEGGDVRGKRVLLLEDLVTTGGSSLAGVEALREEGAIVEQCLVIVTYGFLEAREAFERAGVRLGALTSFPVILEEAVSQNALTEDGKAMVEDWLAEPHTWAERHGL
jgi:orotate phosphoribosyltransferase